MGSIPSAGAAVPDERSASSGESLSVADAFAYAQRLHQQAYVRAAAQVYERILAVEPDHAGALHFLGVALCMMDQTDDGIRFIRRAIELCPDDFDAHNNLGNALRMQGELQEAVHEYERVLAIRPDHVDALCNLGAILNGVGRPEQAVALYRRAITIDPNHVESHHNLGNALTNLDCAKEALEAYTRALTLRPYDGDSYRRLGAACYMVGEIEQATTVYLRWLSLEPDNPAPRHLLAGCTGVGVPDRASDDYVRQMFDRFATSFDSVLQRLEYQAPTLVAAALPELVGQPRAALRVLDAGCGTGLGGPLLRPYAGRLIGVDLSPRMLAAAAKRGIYDELVCEELTGHLEQQSGAYDLIVSIDTLVYFGDLERLSRAFTRALCSGGCLVFTVERADPAESPLGFRINPHGRYSHTESYVRGTLSSAMLEVQAVEAVQLRTEGKKPVAGWLVRAQRPAPSETAGKQGWRNDVEANE